MHVFVLILEEEIAKIRASKVNEPIQEEESGDAMIEQGTQVQDYDRTGNPGKRLC